MSVVSPLIFVVVSMLYLLANAKEIQTNVSTSNCKQYPGMPGLPGSNGVPGVPGTPGSPGRDGTKGEKGSTGKRGLQGATGFPGKLGPQGPSGPKGEIGEKGQSGTVGSKGNAGIPGNIGPRGPKGFNGSIGTKGQKGDTANIDPRQLANWKQCVWRTGTATDNGKIKECSFNKLFDNTAIRVSYQGNIQGYDDTKCNRWYFKFNGNECSGPLPIDSVFFIDWSGGKSEILRPHYFEGFCENLPRGTVLIELWVGKCSGYSLGDAYTGWNSVSRIMIEEVPPPQ